MGEHSECRVVYIRPAALFIVALKTLLCSILNVALFYSVSELVSRHQKRLEHLAAAFKRQDLHQAKRLLQEGQLIERVIKKLDYWNLGNNQTH